MRPDELPTLPVEEGISLRDVVEKVGTAVGAITLVFLLVETVGWPGWLALPPLLLLHWRRTPERADDGPRVTGPPGAPEVHWLEEAYASRQRGTGLSTLAVRYDVDPDWLESELSRPRNTPVTGREGSVGRGLAREGGGAR